MTDDHPDIRQQLFMRRKTTADGVLRQGKPDQQGQIRCGEQYPDRQLRQCDDWDRDLLFNRRTSAIRGEIVKLRPTPCVLTSSRPRGVMSGSTPQTEAVFGRSRSSWERYKRLCRPELDRWQ
jgi:hypothetical protein